MADLSAVEIVRGIAASRFTAQDVVKACLERIQARNTQIRAWEAIKPKLAVVDAYRVDSAAGHGRVRGVPVGVVLGLCIGVPMSCSSTQGATVLLTPPVAIAAGKSSSLNAVINGSVIPSRHTSSWIAATAKLTASSVSKTAFAQQRSQF